MSSIRVLVTGANGFVGNALVVELLRRGFAVTAAVRGEAPVPDGARRAVVADLGGATEWSAALAGCSAVVHAAARVHVMAETAADPALAFHVANVDGSRRLAEQAVALGVSRFVYVSSIKVNGERTALGQPFTERDTPAPVDPYGISKMHAEMQLRELAILSGLELVVVRPPLVYGPGVKANFLSMTNWLARGIPLPFGGVTENRRSFVALDNLVDLLVTTLTHPNAVNQTFLAGDGEDLSTTELLRRTAAALGVPSRLIPVPASALALAARLLGRSDLWQRLGGSLQCSIAHATDRLQWRPPVSVDEGLSRTVACSTPKRRIQ